jgi:hypothetical protein
MKLIIGFYIFVGLCIAFFYWFYRLLNVSKFRGGDGDFTTEVGLSEDSQGLATPHRLGAMSSWEQEMSGQAVTGDIPADQ